MAKARFNKVFKEVNENRSRYRVLLGSAGSGKSVNVAQDYIVKLSNPVYNSCSLLVVRGVEVSHLNSTFAELQAAISKLELNHIWESRLNPLTIRNKINGNSIIFRECNDQRAIERLKSVTVPTGKITWVWCEEATELRKSDFEVIDDRLRGELQPEHYYQITLTFNPVNASHWIKSDLWDYQDENTFAHKSTYLDNIFIDEAYRQRMDRRRERDPDGYSVYGLGNWGETSGLIFKTIDVGDFSKTEFESFSIGTDWGFNHYHATLLIGWKDKEPYVIKEVVVQEKTTSEIITICNRAEIPKNVVMWCDSAEPDRIISFKQAGYMAKGIKKEMTGKGSVNNQITWLKDRTIHIDGRCVNTLKEINAYKWKKDPVSGLYLDEPVNFDDDCMAALRYSCEGIRKNKGLKTMRKGALGL